jgi:RNA recognition motif-containing protein
MYSKKRFHNKNKIRVRINNLPKDIYVKELNDLVSPWGSIGRIDVKYYRTNTTAYIDFYKYDEAEYFMNALNKTPFDHMIIDVEILK